MAQQRFEYEAPCHGPTLILTATDVRPAWFLPMRTTPPVNDFARATRPRGGPASSEAARSSTSGSQSVILRSTNAGVSWVARSASATGTLWGLAASPTRVVAVGENATVVVSP
jgi:hypothetical protein